MEKTRFDVSRRRFVSGLSGVLTAAALPPGFAAAPATVLSGTEFNLEVSSLEVNFTGKKRIATAVNGQVLDLCYVGVRAIRSPCV